MFCPDCGAWNRATAASCARCHAGVPDLPDLPGGAIERPDEQLTQLRRATGARYRVRRRLGTGGMASVYLADHAHLGRPVVIKVLHGHLATDAELMERFRREARAAADLVHPHIVPIIDAGDAAGLVYVVMPFLSGGSLAERIAAGHRSAVEVASAVAQAATALDYAHRRGIVHRDIKPDNILFDEDGHAHVTDFGIAETRSRARLTARGKAMGTPHYMSPEQAMGKLVDGRTDVYALGIVMYECLVGAPPFDGPDGFAVGYKQVHEAPVPPHLVNSEIPLRIDEIVMRCLAKPPDDRYARANDLADALIGFLHAADPSGDALRLAAVARQSG